MIYVTGDCHGDFTRFKSDGLTDRDIVLVTGDFGLWHRSAMEEECLDWLEKQPCTVAFVDGNHENFDRLNGNEFEVVDFHGAKAHKIRNNVFHLMRGEIMELEGKKFFLFGGASSHDIQDGIFDLKEYPSEQEGMRAFWKLADAGKRIRVNRVTWWEEELPTKEEMEHGTANLEKENFEVDYVITHCLPSSKQPKGFGKDRLTKYFDRLLKKGLKFKGWYAGHYHVEEDLPGGFHILYESIVPLGEKENAD